MPNDGRAELVAPMRRLVELLVQRRYDDIEHMTGAHRIPSSDLEQAVADYPKPLTMPPEEAWDRLNVIQVENAPRPTFSVRFDLWAGGKPSDLSVLATLVEVLPGKYQVRLDDLRVL
jgi:hypothetical protein